MNPTFSLPYIVFMRLRLHSNLTVDNCNETFSQYGYVTVMADKDIPPPYSGPTASIPMEMVSDPTYNAYNSPQPYGYTPQQPYSTGQQQAVSNNVVVAQIANLNVPTFQPIPPKDYTVHAWLVCIFCFWPIGIVAILKAFESNDLLLRGDIAGAQRASNYARLMVIISLSIGATLLATLIVVIAVLAVIM